MLRGGTKFTSMICVAIGICRTQISGRHGSQPIRGHVLAHLSPPGLRSRNFRLARGMHLRGPRRMGARCRFRNAGSSMALIGVLLLGSGTLGQASAQERPTSTEAQACLPGSPDETGAARPSTAQRSPVAVGETVKSELNRYFGDGHAMLLAPFHWNRASWTQAAIAAATVAVLTQEDARIDRAISRNRSSRTNAVARVVTPFGSYAAVALSVAPLGAGWLLKNAALRDTGRDAIEAEIFAAGIVTPVLKTAFGRLRPSQGSDADEYRPFSNAQSFPSGHATEAFAVASVFAARSKGWVVPVVAYTLASGVALARVNDRAHFASDVVAGAVIGTAIGHAVVNRHAPDGTPRSWNLVPVTSMRVSSGGYGLAVHFESP